MEKLAVIIAVIGLFNFGVIYWIGCDLKIEMKLRNYLLEEHNEILRNK